MHELHAVIRGNVEHAKVERERQSLRPGRSVANHIQTNATLVDEDWIDFFVANDFEVGVSIDGPRELNDANRVYPDGSGTFDAIHAAVEAMVGRGLSVGALAVVAEQSIPRAKEIFEFFHHSPFVGVDFLPRTCSEQGGGASATCGAPSPEGLASFMIEVFDRWMTESSRRLTIRSLDDAMRTMMGLRPMSCGFQATRACGRQTVTIDCDGEVYACDDFIGAAGFSLGNILEQGLGELLSSHRYRTLLSRIAALPQECTVCKWLDNCDGGCTYRRFLRSPTMEEPDYYCQARKRVFEHIYAWLTGQG
ncbi:MAG: SPASM domain-containing protein [Anaerolineae bacterium]|nr:SPASM domain-containing protein [Anaerolineae bacterium]